MFQYPLDVTLPPHSSYLTKKSCKILSPQVFISWYCCLDIRHRLGRNVITPDWLFKTEFHFCYYNFALTFFHAHMSRLCKEKRQLPISTISMIPSICWSVVVFFKNVGLKGCILHFFTLHCLYLNYSQLIITNLSICKDIYIYYTYIYIIIIYIY